MHYDNVGNRITDVLYIHCCVAVEICIKQEISLHSSKIHPRLQFCSIMHLKRGPLTSLHGRFVMTYTMPNRIIEFSLKFYASLHGLSVLCFINVGLLYLCTPRFLTHPAFCHRKFYGLMRGNPSIDFAQGIEILDGVFDSLMVYRIYVRYHLK